MLQTTVKVLNLNTAVQFRGSVNTDTGLSRLNMLLEVINSYLCPKCELRVHSHKDKQLIPSEEQKVSPDNIPRVQRLQSHTSILPYLPKHLFFGVSLFKVYIFDIG